MTGPRAEEDAPMFDIHITARSQRDLERGTTSFAAVCDTAAAARRALWDLLDDPVGGAPAPLSVGLDELLLESRRYPEIRVAVTA
jgi:hypothetical protein